MEREYQLILVIVNEGFSEQVMDVARSVGAKGGTLVNGRGTAKEEMLAKFKITLTPQKEIVMILSESNNTDNILQAIYSKCGLTTDAHGLAFALPVDEVVGLKKTIKLDENNTVEESVNK